MPEQVVEQDTPYQGEMSTRQITRGIAARCWCDPRVSDREMDSELAEVFAEKIEEYINALRWCGGSSDFAQDGEAREGWEKIVLPLLK
jgi:hypothetical protein